MENKNLDPKPGPFSAENNYGCTHLFTGGAHVLWNILCCPLVLIWNFLLVYVFPCFGAYLHKVHCGSNFVDNSFPHDDSSIGDVSGDTASGGKYSLGQTTWVRVGELNHFKDKSPCLYLDKIEPGDVFQGGLGDCWLMAAIACVAEYPAMIQRLIYQAEYNPNGSYDIRLFDQQKGPEGEWVWITVDDYIPCEKGTCDPKFATPNSNEIWVMLLEKAFAKFCGNYNKLEGGVTIWGIRALTGDYCKYFDPRDNGVKVYNVFGEKSEKSKRELDIVYVDTLSKEMVFATLFEYNKIGALMCTNWSEESQGLVTGHAYSILDVREEYSTKLLQIRNPWGRQGEWKGDWGDESPKWTENSYIKGKLGFEGEKDDGCFWMSFDDFYKFTKTFGVCDRSVTVHTDLHLRIDYENTCYGPLLGCLRGFLRFFCLCKSCAYLYMWRHYSRLGIDKFIQKTVCCCITYNERIPEDKNLDNESRV